MFEKGYFSLGVRTVLAYPMAFVLGGAVLFFLSGITFGIVAGPCLFSLAWMTRRALKGEEVTLADIFSGFEDRIGSAVMAGLALLGFVIMTAAISLPLGSPVLNLPGFIVLAVLVWMFPILVDDDDASFVDAFVGSLEFVEKDVVSRGFFALLLCFVGVGGFVAWATGLLGYGIYVLVGLVLGPWAMVTVSAAYFRELHPEEDVRLPEPATVAPPPPPSTADGQEAESSEKPDASDEEAEPKEKKPAKSRKTAKKKKKKTSSKRKSSRKKKSSEDADAKE